MASDEPARMNSLQTLGGLLVFGGLALDAIGVVWLAVSFVRRNLQADGLVLGLGLLAVVTLPVLGGGVYLLWKGRREARENEVMAKQRRLLDVVQARGQVSLPDLVIELKSSRDQVQSWLYGLVGMGLFSGYINWDEGVLYSAQASQLRGMERCKHCGGELKLAGKGVVRCPYCGTEYFLP